MKRNQLVNMMYMSKSGEITRRRVKLVKITGDSFQAYCFTKRAKRTFTISCFSSCSNYSQGAFSCMISFEQRRLLHKYVVYDMAVQTLQRNYKVIENLKMTQCIFTNTNTG